LPNHQGTSRTPRGRSFQQWPTPIFGTPGTSSPQIIASASGATRDILFGSSAAIPLRAKTDADVREVYWFANKTFIGKGGATEVIAWKSSPGRYELCALDDQDVPFLHRDEKEQVSLTAVMFPPGLWWC
jgi:membrane carboxypeptidase/penicillin-binding protein PbpC